MKNRKRNQKGFSLIELLIVVSIILIIAAIAIPNLLQARVAANEASAVASLRTINTAMLTYFNSYPDVGYAPTIAALGGSTCTAPDENGACIIDNVLSSGTKSGFGFTVTQVGSGPPYYQYLSAAIPVSNGGNRSFCSTQDGVVYYDPTGSAIPDQPTCLALTPLQ
ncbi:MAG: prepilin-type N-terminal cleavage/methylation domain-containing protein [Terriglobales bacterium]